MEIATAASSVRAAIAWILRFEGAQLARVRITADDLLIADDLGRVQAISLRDGAVLRDLRVTV